MLRSLPRNRWGDYFFSAFHFYVAHKRWPRKGANGLINDYFFHLKNSDEFDLAIRQFTSDKHLVKIFVAGIAGEQYVPRTLQIITNRKELEAFVPTEACVIKPTHLSGVVVFCEPGVPLSSEDSDALAKCFDRNFYTESRARNYRDLKGHLIVEEIVDDPTSIRDYKVFCWKGEPRFIQVDTDRHQSHKRNLYDCQWNQLPVRYNFELAPAEEKPHQLEEMLKVARLLSQHCTSLRVDFYITSDRLYVGELTHCPEQGHGRFGSLEEEQLVSSMYFGDSKDCSVSVQK